MEKTRHFRDELLNTLLFHAMIPFAVALLLIVTLFAIIGTSQIRVSNEELQSRTGEEFGSFYADYQEKVYELAHNTDIDRFGSDVVYRSRVIRDVADFLQGQTYRGSFYVYDKYYNLIYQGGNAAFKDQLTSFLPYCTQERLGLIYAQDASAGSLSSAWVMMRPAMTDDIIGYIGFVIPVNYFSSTFHQEGTQTIILSDPYGRVFTNETSPFWNQKKDLVEELRRANGFLSLNNRWYYVTPQKTYQERICVTVVADIDNMVNLVLIVLLIGAVLFAVIAFFVYRSAGKTANRHTDILYEIIDALDEVESGNFDISLDIRSGDEFERIGESFNTMTGSIRDLLQRERTLADEQLTAEMQVMESQFNPRFLMNSLDAIRYLIRLDPEDASQMTVSLSRLLQYSISYEDEVVSLDKELDFIIRYFQFIRFRFGHRLKYRLDIDEACNSCIIPRMLLQPLVEVSMRYGLKEEEGFLEIVIHGNIEGDRLLIRVSDDGPGLDQAELIRLKNALGRVTEKFSPIGAYSVNKRVTLLYGEDYGLSIENGTERGLEMTLSLPRILDMK